MAEGYASPTLDKKALAGQVARAALAGITVYSMRDDRGQPEIVATRWAHTKAFRSIEELRTWLDMVGAPR